MPSLLAPAAPAMRAAIESARDAGERAVARAQATDALTLSSVDGRLETARARAGHGLGLQLFREDGASALAAADRLDDDTPAALLESARRTAAAFADVADPAPAPAETTPHRVEIPEPEDAAWQSLSQPALEGELLALAKHLAGETGPLASLHLAAAYEREEWRILRWDGAEAGFVVPRARLFVAVTARDGDKTGTLRATVTRGHFDLFHDADALRSLESLARQRAQLARDLLHAPPPPSGQLPLVIDHALAKGLAHEALGHAAEADSFRTSVLAEGGRYRRGAELADERVHIVDEPIVGDHAYQPVSAYGVPRRRVHIVRAGRLHEALTDLFSAGELPLRGAARCQSYAVPPLPRMSNIRLELDAPRPLPVAPEEIDATLVRDLLGDAGFFEEYPEVLYLSGYTGGQVNPTTGSFVFNGHASHRLSPTRVELCQPAVFSGSALAALAAIREAFGPLVLDAIGSCGKEGQSVPSSGGSHALLFLAPHPELLVGGRSGA